MDKVCFFTIADDNNLDYAKGMFNSLKRFHPDANIYICSGEDLKAQLDKDKYFFYRATPIIACELLKYYDTVVKIDADSVVTGDLSEAVGGLYDVAVVDNWNPSDEAVYGKINLPGISERDYFNNGFVVIRYREFANRWRELCLGNGFESMPMGEQGFLNCLCHFGEYSVRRLDKHDKIREYKAKHGLATKHRWVDIRVEDNKLMLDDWEVKVIHWGGGGNEKKMGFRTRFSEDVITQLDWLVSGEENVKKKKTRK